MSADNALVVALDVGGTSVKAGLVDRRGSLAGEPRQYDACSDRDRETILERFASIVADQLAGAAAMGRPVAGIGVGMPGPFDYAAGVSLIRGLSKYEAIYGINLAEEWRQRLQLPANLPIRFVNDASAFALGEALYGAGRGQERVMAITLGTGCGAAFLVGGRLVEDGHGVPPGGAVYHLPFEGGMIDEWISRRGILRLWREMAPEGTHGFDVKEIAAAARAGDAKAGALWDRWGNLLAAALGPVAEAFRPGALVLGGQIARSLDLFGESLRERVAAAGGQVVGASDQHPALRGAASLIWGA
ncbi:MAG TPA: ROK family protein [Symbiobacteriaceae bacterium]|nr:ROK family protein [Symbiobacteriaceae bacterium]